MEDPDRPIRMDKVQDAVRFLTNPRVGSGNTEVKIAFLKHKDLTDKEILEALKISRGPVLGKGAGPKS